MKLFVEVDVVVIVPALVLHYRASFSFYVSLFSWRLKTNIVLDLNFQFAFILIDVGNHIVLYFYFLFVFLLETFK